MLEVTTCYRGSCHCGAVRFEVEADIRELTACDCSLCTRRGGRMAIVPDTALRLTAGHATLARYTWNTHRAQHHFCSTCGVYVFHRKRAMPRHFSVNASCLDGLDATALPLRATDGAGMSVVACGARPEWPGPRVSAEDA